MSLLISDTNSLSNEWDEFNKSLDFSSFQSYCIKRIENVLENLMPASSHLTVDSHLDTNAIVNVISLDSNTISKAMRYSVLNGGKRLRPLLVYAVGATLGLTESQFSKLDIPAAALELIHCYSLIHDDLPSMDNDDLRRGKPTCHKEFNEATAILAGDALQSLAFEILSNSSFNSVSPELQIKMINMLAQSIGKTGMVGGQALDIDSEHKSISIEQLISLHQMKTGALIRASVLLGAIAANCCHPTEMSALQCYADNMGLAFQVQDDILDITSSTETLGKTKGKDAANAKATFPALMGIDNAKLYMQTLQQNALAAIQSFGKNAKLLTEISHFFIQRQF